MPPKEASEPAQIEKNETLSRYPVKTTGDVQQQGGVLAYLASLLTVREVAVSGEPTGSERFAWIWMLWALDSRWKSLSKDTYFTSWCHENMSKTVPGCQEGCYK